MKDWLRLFLQGAREEATRSVGTGWLVAGLSNITLLEEHHHGWWWGLLVLIAGCGLMYKLCYPRRYVMVLR